MRRLPSALAQRCSEEASVLFCFGWQTLGCLLPVCKVARMKLSLLLNTSEGREASLVARSQVL